MISIFPEMFQVLTEQGVVGRALQQDGVSLTVHNPRDFSDDKHRRVDDRPYGGGPGMVMSAEPLVKAIDAAKSAVAESSAEGSDCAPKVVYLSPQGQPFDHATAQATANESALILLAGRYEGVDERVLANHVDEEWSIGDYVLSGGELAAMVVIDAVTRLLPDSLGNCESAQQDSFADGLLDCPHYTRPENFAGDLVPKVLTNGDHEAIKRWRLKQSLGCTWLRRPDLLKKLDLDEQQQRLLEEFKHELDD